MRALLAALTLALAWQSSSSAANALTQAERDICSNLRHCISILERHSHDEFTYPLLAREFAAFGRKGRKALIGLLEQGGAEGAHAADLIALGGDRKIVKALRSLESTSKAKDPALVSRTIEALLRRLDGTQSKVSHAASLPVEIEASKYCDQGVSLEIRAQSQEMPFFETDIARPDLYGAYRPSAAFRLAIQHADRADLTSAASIFGGWVAGYSGGLVHYNSKTGEPTLLSRAHILSVQRIKPDTLSGAVWVVSSASDQMIISRTSAFQMISLIPLDGSLSDLRRTADGTLWIISSQGETLRLFPDGTHAMGCPT